MLKVMVTAEAVGCPAPPPTPMEGSHPRLTEAAGRIRNAAPGEAGSASVPPFPELHRVSLHAVTWSPDPRPLG